MNIDELTIGEARRLVAILQPGVAQTNGSGKHIGRYCVIRTQNAGVHVGIVAFFAGREVTLTDSRRIWSWTGALSLSEISQRGVTGGKIACVVPEISLTEAIEIIPCSAAAEKILREVAEARV